MLCRGETFNFSVINPQGGVYCAGGRARTHLLGKKFFGSENLFRAGNFTLFVHASLMDGLSEIGVFPANFHY
jgi:hypothetical protein